MNVTVIPTRNERDTPPALTGEALISVVEHRHTRSKLLLDALAESPPVRWRVRFRTREHR